MVQRWGLNSKDWRQLYSLHPKEICFIESILDRSRHLVWGPNQRANKEGCRLSYNSHHISYFLPINYHFDSVIMLSQTVLWFTKSQKIIFLILGIVAEVPSSQRPVEKPKYCSYEFILLDFFWWILLDRNRFSYINVMRNPIGSYNVCSM